MKRFETVPLINGLGYRSRVKTTGCVVYFSNILVLVGANKFQFLIRRVEPAPCFVLMMSMLGERSAEIVGRITHNLQAIISSLVKNNKQTGWRCADSVMHSVQNRVASCVIMRHQTFSGHETCWKCHLFRKSRVVNGFAWHLQFLLGGFFHMDVVEPKLVRPNMSHQNMLQSPPFPGTCLFQKMKKMSHKGSLC